MGGVWSYFQDDQHLFHKSVHLRYPSESDIDHSGSNGSDAQYSSKVAFYETLKHAVTRIELTRASESSLTGGSASVTRDNNYGDMEPDDRAHVNVMLAHWLREVDVVYDRHDEFPITITLERELDAQLSTSLSATQIQQSEASTPNESLAIATQEEAITNGLCANQLSSSEAIHQAVEQLRSKLGSGPNTDEFLRVLAKYPRAVRLVARQQLHTRSDVALALRLHMLHHDYARAAYIVGKLAYGDEEASHIPKKLQRLQLMSSLLQRSLDQLRAERKRSSPSTRAALSFDQVMTDEMVELLQCQRNLEATLGVEHLVGSSLIETLHKLVALYPLHVTALSMAVTLAEQFDVHPRQFSYALLKVLAQTEQWQTLLVVTAAARPAIGYKPVMELLLDEDHVDLVHDLLALIDAPHEREEITTLLAAYNTQKQKSSTSPEDEQGASATNVEGTTDGTSSNNIVGPNE